MSLDYINEAFRSLELLTEDMFRADADGFNDLSDFMTSDLSDEESISIIDMDAETEDDLKDSYIGKVIIDCNVCHSHIFKDKGTITLDVDGLIDLEEDCPYCGENNGFVIIGEIHEYNPESEDEENTSTESDASDMPTDSTIDDSSDEPNPIIEESLSEKVSRKYKPSTVRLLKMIGSHLADGMEENLDENFEDDLGRQAWSQVAVKAYTNAAQKLGLNNFDMKMDRDDRAIITYEKDGQEHTKSIDGNLTHITSENEAEKLLTYVITDLKELDESFKNVSLETDDERMTMSSEDNGKVTVTTEPIEHAAEGEIITPISDETENEIISANAEIIDETPSEENIDDVADELDLEIDEIDDESMTELGESYLKQVYENVESFKLSNCSMTDKQLVLEGIIRFKSGITKNTGFIFEAKDATKDGKLKFIGENAHLARGRKAFTLVGSLNESKKLICESFTYNYRAKDLSGKSTRVYGKVNRNK